MTLRGLGLSRRTDVRDCGLSTDAGSAAPCAFAARAKDLLARADGLLEARDRADEGAMQSVQPTDEDPVDSPSDDTEAGSPSVYGAELREHRRVGVDVEVSGTSDSGFFTGLTENISEGGLFVATECPWPRGTTLELSLRIEGGRPIGCQAVVRWLREVQVDGVAAGMGLSFENLADEDLAAIQNYIDSRARDTLLYED